MDRRNTIKGSYKSQSPPGCLAANSKQRLLQPLATKIANNSVLFPFIQMHKPHKVPTTEQVELYMLVLDDFLTTIQVLFQNEIRFSIYLINTSCKTVLKNKKDEQVMKRVS